MYDFTFENDKFNILFFIINIFEFYYLMEFNFKQKLNI